MIKLLFVFFAFGFADSETRLEPKGDCDLELSYAYYNICYSPTHRQAIWTYHSLTRSHIQGPQKRINDYKRELRLNDPVGSRDFKGSGFDRGHLVPAGDMKLNRLSMTDTFYMTNMSPQRAGFNSGIWRSLESHIRRQVLSLGEALVVTAPVLLEDEDYNQIQTGVSIPMLYYKIAYYREADMMEAYLIPNATQSGKQIDDFRVSVDEIEELTGYDFYSGLSDEFEERLESRVLDF